MKIRVTIYVDEYHWRSFMDCCRREGDPASGKIDQYVSEYLAGHGQGNPQTLLDYAEKPKCLPLWKTCRESKGELRQGLFTCRKHGLMNPVRCEGLAHRVVNSMDVGCYRLKEAP
jgi:hypothetical protein